MAAVLKGSFVLMSSQAGSLDWRQAMQNYLPLPIKVRAVIANEKTVAEFS
jgi:hypothetical protein